MARQQKMGGRIPRGDPARDCTCPGAGRCRPSSAGLHPPFSLGLAQRKRAVHGPKERRFRPLYTKADGRFLRRYRPGPGAFCRLRSPFCVNRYCSAASRRLGWSTGCRTERPLRVGPGRSASLRPTAVVIVYCPGMRVTRGSRRTVLSVFHHDDCRTSATCGGKLPTSISV